MKEIALVLLTAAGALGLALRPEFSGTWQLWAYIAGPYALLAFLALFLQRGQKATPSRLSFNAGDVSIGVVSGLTLAGVSYLLVHPLAKPGSDVFAWLFQIYAQVGNYQSNPLFLVLLLITVVSEELVWRGLVQSRLQAHIGIWSVPATAILYCLATAPTLVALRDPNAGLNPLVMGGALAGGLLWGLGAHVFKRLPPVMLSHFVFTYFAASPAPSWLSLTF